MPYASIIVPAFNSVETLPQTLLSLRSQTFRDFEIIVVNDGSTDDTARVAAEAAKLDHRIRLVEQGNRGLAGARNSGIAAASGVVVGLCDADDLWMPEKLAAHVGHLAVAPHVGLSYTGSALINYAGQRIGHAQRPKLYGVTASHVFKRNPIGNGSAPVFRRAALEALAYRPHGETERDWVFDETFRQSEDIECWLRLCLTTDWSLEGVPGLLTEYRLSAGGLSARTDAQLAAWERMVSKLRPTAPDFFARHENAARAYQLRYLARRAVTGGDGAAAMDYLRRALRLSKTPLFEEPLRTLTTVAAAVTVEHLGRDPMQLLSYLRPRAGS
ncbi:glycosyltransferase family 2 protein [Celeribacter litoreus]|uniref:glycosyltransferase family 2 protein n=1 Tax=Celeribacter litoreus TaxID=2876714 RepID=UPI001CCA1046|nr:glycosyltransferase family 2 protein [Celeribacter litoreus]MCA0044212.1 glycosyltransferase [Celeribacter litoreus]